MARLLRPILGRLRRRFLVGTSSPDQPRRPEHERHLARALAEGIDRAMNAGLWDHAERLADAAGRLAPDCARLSEQMARLRLTRGDAETALRIVEGCRTMPASLRLLRAVCLWLVGERIEVHLDLHRWSAKAAAPLDARLLLGLIELRLGDVDRSIEALQRNLRHLEDPRTLEALILVHLLNDRPDQADAWAQRLRCGRHLGDVAPEADPLLRSLGMPGLPDEAEPTQEHVANLAMELICFEPAIDVLVAAQHSRFHLPTVRLLAPAIAKALPDLNDASAGMHALARLSLLRGQRQEAKRWAERGLAQNPMSAPLAIMLRELSESDPQAPAGLAADGADLPPSDQSGVPPQEKAA